HNDYKPPARPNLTFDASTPTPFYARFYLSGSGPTPSLAPRVAAVLPATGGAGCPGCPARPPAALPAAHRRNAGGPAARGPRYLPGYHPQRARPERPAAGATLPQHRRRA
nr:hypothetical protein [Tanacetum cinerariifolium]